MKTLDYDVAYHRSARRGGRHPRAHGGEEQIKPRDPAVRVDYVVKQTPSGYRVVDIITENLLTKNYYDQFRKKMNDPTQGYPNIVDKLREKISR